MLSCQVQRVSVWLDELAPAAGAFPHAVEWACQLGWSLRIVARPGNSRGSGDGGKDDCLGRCEVICRQRGVSWEVAGDGLGRDDLYVLSDALLPAMKAKLLRQTLSLPGAGVLLCPRTRQSVSRVLVVVQDHDPAGCFLDAAVAVCRSLAAEPVVLTLASSEGEARQRERVVAERFARHQMVGEFDAVIGGDLREAVAWVARLRRCSLVVVERQAPSWWRRFRGETVERLSGLAKTTSVLALPCTWPAGRENTSTCDQVQEDVRDRALQGE
jgi:hypothetical protein